LFDYIFLPLKFARYYQYCTSTNNAVVVTVDIYVLYWDGTLYHNFPFKIQILTRHERHVWGAFHCVCSDEL